MKYNELIRLILRNNWTIIRQRGSHIIFKKGDTIYPVPNHGSKEVAKRTEAKIRKEMKLEDI